MVSTQSLPHSIFTATLCSINKSQIIGYRQKGYSPKVTLHKKQAQNSKLRSLQPLSCTVAYHIPTGVLELPLGLCQLLKSGNLNLVVVVIFAPQKSTSTTNKGFLPPAQRVGLLAPHWLQQKISPILPLSLWFTWFRIICLLKSLLKWGLERGHRHI